MQTHQRLGEPDSEGLMPTLYGDDAEAYDQPSNACGADAMSHGRPKNY